MDFSSKEELYQKLFFVFEVKKRLIQGSGYSHITSLDIWNYLIDSKWRNASNLMFYEVVNDIINLDMDKFRDMEECR